MQRCEMNKALYLPTPKNNAYYTVGVSWLIIALVDTIQPTSPEIRPSVTMINTAFPRGNL